MKIPTVCNLIRYSKNLLVGARDILPFSLEDFFHVKICVSHDCFRLLSFYICLTHLHCQPSHHRYQYITTVTGEYHTEQCLFLYYYGHKLTKEYYRQEITCLHVTRNVCLHKTIARRNLHDPVANSWKKWLYVSQTIQGSRKPPYEVTVEWNTTCACPQGGLLLCSKSKRHPVTL